VRFRNFRESGRVVTEDRGDMKKLRRSARNRYLAGVCGGIAEYYEIRSFWVRLGFFFLILPGGLPGVIPYLILWLAIPREEFAVSR
jgi:phage shock protein C